MSATTTALLPIAAVLLAACGSTATRGIPAPDGQQSYVGTSASDIWHVSPEAENLVRHWDGREWRDIDLSSIGPAVRPTEVVGPDTMWLRQHVGFDWTLYTLSADGTTEAVDLPPAPEAPFDNSVAYVLHGGGDAVFATAEGREAPSNRARTRLYRRDGDAWTELPALPDGANFGGVRVGTDGEIMAEVTDWTYSSQCAAVDPNQATVVNPVIRDDVMHGDPSPYVWLRDGAWVRLSGTRCMSFDIQSDGASLPNPTFPIHDLWSRHWHFDGAVIRPLMVPGALSYRGLYTHVDGETVRISEAPRGAAGGGAASENDEFSCDTFGNCTPVGDTFTFVGTEWIAERWNGAAWVGRRSIARGQTCAGFGCIYVGDEPGIVGQLDDGTVLIYQSGDGAATLALVEP